jgi:hypothetical protein
LDEAKILTRDEILNADDLRYESVYVDEWGGTVIVKSLTGTERDEMEQSMLKDKGGKNKKPDMDFGNLRSRLVALSVADKDGNKLFGIKDVEALGKKNAAALGKIFTIAQRLSGLGEKELELLEKNSESGQQEDSISD